VYNLNVPCIWVQETKYQLYYKKKNVIIKILSFEKSCLIQKAKQYFVYNIYLISVQYF